jgi:ABC-type Mn2+/Zn2+ transport system permease subunit
MLAAMGAQHLTRGAAVVMFAVAAVLALAGTALLGRSWAAVGFDPDAAHGLGLPVAQADALLLGLVALAAVAAIPAVGALLVTSLFVVPAAIARLLTASLSRLLCASVALAAAVGLSGLYLAYWLDVPPGPAVAALGAVAYAVAVLALAARGRARPQVARPAAAPAP